MRKPAIATVCLMMILIFAAPADAALRVNMPDGTQINSDEILLKNGRAYVDIDLFSHFDGVITWPDFPYDHEPISSVAVLWQQNESRTTLIVVNKLTREVHARAWGLIREGTRDLDVVIEDNGVYLPLRATAEFLGATVTYDPATDTATITQPNFQ